MVGKDPNLELMVRACSLGQCHLRCNAKDEKELAMRKDSILDRGAACAKAPR